MQGNEEVNPALEIRAGGMSRRKKPNMYLKLEDNNDVFYKEAVPVQFEISRESVRGEKADDK